MYRVPWEAMKGGPGGGARRDGRGDAGPLRIPIAVKDLYDTAGVRTTAKVASGRTACPRRIPPRGRGSGEAGRSFSARQNTHEWALRHRRREPPSTGRAQPVGPGARHGRVEQRLGDGDRRGPLRGGAGERHGRIDPDARRAVRPRRDQADLRPHCRFGIAPRLVARPSRSHDKVRGGLPPCC